MEYHKLLQPKVCPFGLIIFYPSEGKISLKNFPENIIESDKLNDLTKKGVYCNSVKDLYISEGKNFWIINNNTFSIIRKDMPINKTEHSMIYLESLGTFLVGGIDKKSFFYDTKKNYFMNWANTNELHICPALIQIGDYLYIFDDLKKENGCFERTKLKGGEKKWEKIIPNYDKDIICHFPSTGFGVALDINGDIIFLGGDNIDFENNKSFVYNIKENKLYLSENGTNDKVILSDKTFYKINQKNSIALPCNINETKEICSFSNNDQSLMKIIIDFSEVSEPVCNECMKNIEQNQVNGFNEKKNLTQKVKVMKKNIEVNLDSKEKGYYISRYCSKAVQLKAEKDNIKTVKPSDKYVPYTICNRKITHKKIVIKTDIKKVENKKNIEKINHIQEKKIKEEIKICPEKKIEHKIEKKIEPVIEKKVEPVIEKKVEPVIEQKVGEVHEQKDIPSNNELHLEAESEKIESPQKIDQQIPLIEENEQKIEDVPINEEIKEEHYQNFEEKEQKIEEPIHEAQEEKIEEQVETQDQQVEENIENKENENVLEKIQEIKSEENEEKSQNENIVNKEIEEKEDGQNNSLENQPELKEEEHINIEQEDILPKREGEEEPLNANVEGQNQVVIEEKYTEQVIGNNPADIHIEEKQINIIQNPDNPQDIHIDEKIVHVEPNPENPEKLIVQEENIHIEPKEITEEKKEEKEEEKPQIEEKVENKEEIVHEEEKNESVKEKSEDIQDSQEIMHDEEFHKDENVEEVHNDEINIEHKEEPKEVHKDELEEQNIEGVQISSELKNEDHQPIKEDENKNLEGSQEIKDIHYNEENIFHHEDHEDNHEEFQDDMEHHEEHQYEVSHEEQDENQNEEQDEQKNVMISGEMGEGQENQEELENDDNEEHMGENGEEINFEDENGEDEKGEEYEEEEQAEERDSLKKTLTQNIGEDVMQITEYPVNIYFKEENFCDYKP